MLCCSLNGVGVLVSGGKFSCCAEPQAKDAARLDRIARLLSQAYLLRPYVTGAAEHRWRGSLRLRLWSSKQPASLRVLDRLHFRVNLVHSSCVVQQHPAVKGLKQRDRSCTVQEVEVYMAESMYRTSA